MKPFFSIFGSILLIGVALFMQWRYFASTRTTVGEEQAGTLRNIFIINTVLLVLLEALIIYGILRGTNG